MTRSDFIGAELDWYAVDQEGFVAVFLSSGWGPVPDQVFARFTGWQSIQSKVNLSATPIPDKGLVATAERLSDLGFFGYDWLNSFGPYNRFVVPKRAARICELRWDKELEGAFISIPQVRFSESSELVAAQIPEFTDADKRLR